MIEEKDFSMISITEQELQSRKIVRELMQKCRSNIKKQNKNVSKISIPKFLHIQNSTVQFTLSLALVIHWTIV